MARYSGRGTGHLLSENPCSGLAGSVDKVGSPWGPASYSRAASSVASSPAGPVGAAFCDQLPTMHLGPPSPAVPVTMPESARRPTTGLPGAKPLSGGPSD